ncbi:N(G),N(G)-dimethylarginine dimethylaminohydrolase 1-like [Branchiostoma floridae]|uniref:N(G),N(G)-dimethylarginine dimethylaminohydrolase 1-like n=1 Tax=Branchiostoma floridae TaxID=7739 RepID=A0A9J7MAX0_BRAFL|nr:N(G),N(G)-dimethylarginine dimethylaminohydrolase 1-like [Branchiostoma floridae]
MGQSESGHEYEVGRGSTNRPTPPLKEPVTRETFPTYTRAIVRQIPSSIRHRSEAIQQYEVDCCSWFLGGEEFYYSDHDREDPINLRRARRQHARYVRTLRDLGLDVTVLPADESTPDCPFVEDTCVVVGNRALVTRPEGMARRKEAFDSCYFLYDGYCAFTFLTITCFQLNSIETCLRSLGLEVHRIRNMGATLEGGDVVFTGTEFFVGDSTQSNWLGHRILAATFPEYPVHAIPLYPPEFHLKGVACCAAPGVIALAQNSAGRLAWDVIRRKGVSSYQPLWLPDCHAVDCIYVNGTLLHCAQTEGHWNCEVTTSQFYLFVCLYFFITTYVM